MLVAKFGTLLSQRSEGGVEFFSDRSKHHKDGTPDRKLVSAAFLLIAIMYSDIVTLRCLLHGLFTLRLKGQTVVGIDLKWRKKKQ